MRYATFEDYIKKFSGRIFTTDKDFLYYEKKAHRWIDWRTRQRASMGTEWDDDLMEATCAIAEIMYEEDMANQIKVSVDGEQRQIASESIDGASITYVTSKTDTATIEGREYIEDKKESTIREYLLHTNWLYPGAGR